MSRAGTSPGQAGKGCRVEQAGQGWRMLLSQHGLMGPPSWSRVGSARSWCIPGWGAQYQYEGGTVRALPFLPSFLISCKAGCLQCLN